MSGTDVHSPSFTASSDDCPDHRFLWRWDILYMQIWMRHANTDSYTNAPSKHCSRPTIACYWQNASILLRE